jgi:hypothetical protein
MNAWRFLLAFLLLLPAACGDLPQPFRGNPGRDGARLAVPMALRLAVPPPAEALLTDDAAKHLASDLADALQAEEIPAVATDRPMPLDWRVDIRAEAGPGGVTPRFRLLNADGEEQGVVPGPPISPVVWTSPEPESFRLVAMQAAKGIETLLLQVDAARKQMDPVALAGGPARIRFTGVTGAPGDGNAALSTRMREFLGRYGYVMQEASEGATFGLEGRVNIVPIAGNQQRVEIAWRVSRRDGQELGQVVQMNEMPAGSLKGFWGDVAFVVAQEASGGIRTVLTNATNAASGAPAASSATSPPGASPPGSASPGPNAPAPPGPAAETGNAVAAPPSR